MAFGAYRHGLRRTGKEQRKRRATSRSTFERRILRLPVGAKGGAVALSNIDLDFFYGAKQAVFDLNLNIPANKVTALIGPSGCGKSTFLRNLNRMNETIRNSRYTGEILLDGQDIKKMDVVNLRRRVGMVFQRPNPFAKSIFENVAYGLRINGYKGRLPDLVEHSLRRAALWDEVKDHLHKSAFALSGGQQQRLCIARALAVDPEVCFSMSRAPRSTRSPRQRSKS